MPSTLFATEGYGKLEGRVVRRGRSLVRNRSWPLSRLLLYPQNRVLCGLGNTKFDDGFGRNLDLLLRLWIKAGACLPLLLHQLAKTGQDKFAVLFNLFVGERAKRIEEYSSGSFVGLGGFSECGLKFCLGMSVRL